jgi:hypothetical protein
MGMAGEQHPRVGGKRGCNVGRMAEQDRRAPGRPHRAHRPRDIGMTGIIVVDAADRERAAHDGAVREHRNTGAGQRRADRGGAGPMIVVAEHRDDAERRAQPGERHNQPGRDQGRAARRFTRDEIARDHDQVGCERIDPVGDPRQSLLVHHRGAEVDVADQRHGDRPFQPRDDQRRAAHHRVGARLQIHGAERARRDHHRDQRHEQLARSHRPGPVGSDSAASRVCPGCTPLPRFWMP